MVVTNSEETADKLKLLRDNGRTGWYEHAIIGYNSRLDGLQASILRVKLKHLDKWVEARRKHAAKYDEFLAGIEGSSCRSKADAKHSYYVYVVRVGNRDAVMAQLKEKGCGCGIHYPIPLHLQPAFSFLGGKVGDFPVAERYARESSPFRCSRNLPPIRWRKLGGIIREVVSGS